jgi:hypothetical protein
MRLLGVQSVGELSMEHVRNLYLCSQSGVLLISTKVNIRAVEAQLYDGQSGLLPIQKGDLYPKL